MQLPNSEVDPSNGGPSRRLVDVLRLLFFFSLKIYFCFFLKRSHHNSNNNFTQKLCNRDLVVWYRFGASKCRCCDCTYFLTVLKLVSIFVRLHLFISLDWNFVFCLCQFVQPTSDHTVEVSSVLTTELDFVCFLHIKEKQVSLHIIQFNQHWERAHAVD